MKIFSHSKNNKIPQILYSLYDYPQIHSLLYKKIIHQTMDEKMAQMPSNSIMLILPY